MSYFLTYAASLRACAVPEMLITSQMTEKQKSLYLNVATLEYLFQTLPIDVYGITSSTLKIS